ncbi:hypothetical protein BU15DRAFT_71206 [Melanogaster broomeanus]|nr:hypothetical protein BU15DRAFT_71206 [Melanogaster broomeanus]
MDSQLNRAGHVRFNDNPMEIDPPSSSDHFAPPAVPSQTSSWERSTQSSSPDLSPPSFQPPPIPDDFLATSFGPQTGLRFPTPPILPSSSPSLPSPTSIPEDDALPIPMESQFNFTSDDLASPTSASEANLESRGPRLPPTAIPNPVVNSAILFDEISAGMAVFGQSLPSGSLSQDRLRSIMSTFNRSAVGDGDLSPGDRSRLEFCKFLFIASQF